MTALWLPIAFAAILAACVFVCALCAAASLADDAMERRVRERGERR